MKTERQRCLDIVQCGIDRHKQSLRSEYIDARGRINHWYAISALMKVYDKINSEGI
jgi:hypothetical protein